MVPELVLNSGKKMPVIGFGTGTDSLPPSHQLVSIILDAIKAGYRHFDTAQIYGSEECLGKAVNEALQQRLIKDRNDIFITSKLWCTHADPLLVLPALKETLQRMGLEYVDLYLIHWPVRLKREVIGINISKSDILPFDMKGTWEAMEECSKLGLANSIGVSNFSIKKLEKLLEHATIPPAVNQVEMNVAWQQEKLRDFCKEKGIYVYAYSPLSANGAIWGSTAVMESPIVKDIAMSKRKTIAQVALRWIYEQEAGMIVKSFNKDRMKWNIQIFDWDLTEDDLIKIKEIPQCRACAGEIFLAQDGTLEELWDGEQ